MVDVFLQGLGDHKLPELIEIHALRDSVQQHMQRHSSESSGRPDDERDDHHRRDRVDPIGIREHDKGATDKDDEGPHSVGDQMQNGTFHVE